MKIGLYVLNIVFILLMSCGEDKSSAETRDSVNNDQKPIITAKAIEDFDYTDYVLSADSEKAVENWEKYQELAIQISYLKKADVSFFSGEKTVLKEFITEFRSTIPEQFLTNPILSRTLILETALLKLNENLTLGTIEDSTKLVNVEELLIAFSNLNYHLNKKLESDLYNKIQPE